MVELPDGRSVRWEGFYTGPVELSDAEVEHAAQRLLGIPAERVPDAAAQRLLPSTHDDGTSPCIVMHSATPVLKNLQGDLDEVMRGRIADDTATYMETRAVSLAGPGDLVVGRTHPWQLAARHAGVEAVRIPGIDYYYLSQALLQLMVTSNCQAVAIGRLADALASRPDTVIRLYSMDLELQIVLLCLQRLAGIERIFTDANSPEVASFWNTKAPVYPRVTDVIDIRAATPRQMLAAETEAAPMRQLLGLSYERLPGYAVQAAEEGELLLAARLMRERYGLSRGCLKPSKGGGGARIVPDVDLADEAALHELSEKIRDTGELFLIEAQVDYLPVTVGGQMIRAAPSAHVRHGRVAEGLTLQLTRGAQWQGNIYLDRAGCDSLGLPADMYDRVRRTVWELKAALAERDLELVTGGVDFAVGTPGGFFQNDLFMAVQDPNLSSHGAEYLRRFAEHVRATGGPTYAATKVIHPTRSADLPALMELSPQGMGVICCVPGRWGMLAAAAASPHLAVRAVLAFERHLAERGLARG